MLPLTLCMYPTLIKKNTMMYISKFFYPCFQSYCRCLTKTELMYKLLTVHGYILSRSWFHSRHQQVMTCFKFASLPLPRFLPFSPLMSSPFLFHYRAHQLLLPQSKIIYADCGNPGFFVNWFFVEIRRSV